MTIHCAECGAEARLVTDDSCTPLAEFYECPNCGRAGRVTDGTHEGNRQHICPLSEFGICNESYDSIEDLNEHIKTAHESNPDHAAILTFIKNTTKRDLKLHIL